jgi:nucleoside-diphosphate-sugar epimerase
MTSPLALVTGGTGFTGSHLIQALVRDGQPVRAIARSAPKARQMLPASVEVVEGDITDPGTVERAMAGVQTVYHLAAAFREAKHMPGYYRRVNVDGTRLLLEAALERGVQRFVHCSTGGVRSHIEHPPGDETLPHKPGDAYQRSKSEGEKLALAFHRRYGLPVTVARPTPIYGPGDTRLLKMFRLVAQRRFVILGRGDIYFHMVHVNDLVTGLRLLGEHPRAVGEVFILGGEECLRLRSVLDLIAGAVGAPPPWLRLPLWPFELAAILCEAVCVPLGLEPPLHRRRVHFFRNSRAFTIDKAKRLLGYRPRVELRRGIQETADWYAAHGMLPKPRVARDRRRTERRRAPRLTPVGR